jgi:protein ImuB
MGKGTMTELYVCVHVPEFPAQALLRLRPDLARSPVVVLQGEPPLEQVCSANVLALRLGICNAMTRAELDSFTGLHILKRSVAEERNTQAALLSSAGVYTPRVEVQPAVGSAWTMVLDMAGSTSMFGPIEHSIRRIHQSLKSLRFSVRVAASCNLHTAVCIASSASRAPIIVPQGDEAQHLASLPLTVLALTPQQTDAFELWGLHTLGELAGLPEVDLIVRLGQEGKRLRLLARGEHPHLMVPEEPVFVLEEFLELDAPVELLDSLLFVLGSMLGQLIARAQNHAFALASVTVRLGLDGAGEHERTIKPALPVADRELLLKLLHLDLQAHPPPAGVVSVFVSAEPGERSKVQLGLFSPQLPEPMRLDITLARIAALVGEDRVGRARLLDTHKPESFQMERFLVPSTSSKSKPRVSNSVALRRCRPPVPIPMRQDGKRPTAFHLRGTLYAIEQAYGPWRRSGDWWSPQVWSSEEWDVQAKAQDSTLLCVISHDLLRKQWQLEALYD